MYSKVSEHIEFKEFCSPVYREKRLMPNSLNPVSFLYPTVRNLYKNLFKKNKYKKIEF